MPTHKVKNGYKWGKSGKVYPTKELADRQGRAIYANGWCDKKTCENMNKTIMRLTESQLKNIISESIKEIVAEKRGINSPKLYDIVKEHGGLAHGNRGVFNLNDMTDEDIISVVDFQTLCHICDLGIEEWAKKKGIKLGVADTIHDLELNDGKYIIAILRGGRFDRISKSANDTREKGDGDFEYLYKKTEDRRKNYPRNKYSWNNKDAEDLFNNPYFRNGEGNWTPTEKKHAIDNIRLKKYWFDHKR